MARSEGPKAGHGLPDGSKGNGNDSVKGVKSSMVVLGKILIMDLEVWLMIEAVRPFLEAMAVLI